jgi:Protein of unknown function (DUF992)
MRTQIHMTFAAGLVMISMAPTASAQGVLQVGTLTCTGEGGVGLILGSKKSYDCKFAPAGGGRPQPYAATVTRLGLDLGVTGKTVMVWTVLATANSARPGLLAGTYVGAAADASVGVGAGAKVLVGGSNRSITLQPLSVQGQGGINLAVGVAEMAIR